MYTSATKLAFTAFTTKLLGFNLVIHFIHKLQLFAIIFRHRHITRSTGTTKVNRLCLFITANSTATDWAKWWPCCH